MSEASLSVLDGSTFIVSDRHGDVIPGGGREHGVYAEDTRMISRWVLRLGTTPLELLGVSQESHFEVQFVLAPQVAVEDQVWGSVVRHRVVDHACLEEITFTNHSHATSRVTLSLDVDADFADLFEVKEGVVADRTVSFTHDDRSLTLAYVAGDFSRSVTVSSSAPAQVTRAGFRFPLELAAGAQWTTTLTILPRAAQPGVRFTARTSRGTLAEVRAARAQELDGWLAAAPVLETEDRAILATYRASLSDLGALRMHPDLSHRDTLPAAGLPWFMALFGRDSLLTSFQALPYLPTLGATTLRVLAARQAGDRDDFHEREPGKILHELRFGELTARGERPHSPYFGSADATPLFLVLLDEYHRWTGDDALVRDLETHARAALDWIWDSGDADGDGYVEYLRRNLDSGLANQCWKDSWDSIQFADGTLARGPIATCEIQGYVYDAYRRCARLAREVWDDAPFAEGLERRAAALRARFRQDFWVADRGCVALALDGDKRRVDSLSSNIGHLLWSGILDEDQAAATARSLMGEALYSGWGVRTLGAGEAGYNPLGYHTGTVWPHENSLIVAGLARYGHHEAAARVGTATLAAATYFEHRLPEVFAGFPVSLTSAPVRFPTASRPQAWAAGAPLLLLSTLLGLTPRDTQVTGRLGRGSAAEVSLSRPRDTHPPSPSPSIIRKRQT